MARCKAQSVIELHRFMIRFGYGQCGGHRSNMDQVIDTVTHQASTESAAAVLWRYAELRDVYNPLADIGAEYNAC